jgi:flagellar motor switch protein FliG
MADTTLDITGVRKAAILFVALGEEVTSNVFPFLQDEEIQDLIAYLVSGGDPESAMFR